MSFNAPNNSSIMGSVPKAKLGTAGGLNALVRNIGMVLGISISVSLFSFRLHSLTGGAGNLLAPSGTEAEQTLSSLHFVFWTAMGICLIGALLSSLRLRKA